jgi:small subunit ribosomal protein S2e
MANTFSYLTPDLWKETVFQKTPYQEYSDFLQNTQTKASKRE